MLQIKSYECFIRFKDEDTLETSKMLKLEKVLILFKSILNITMALLLLKISKEYQTRIRVYSKISDLPKTYGGLGISIFPPQWA